MAHLGLPVCIGASCDKARVAELDPMQAHSLTPFACSRFQASPTPTHIRTSALRKSRWLLWVEGCRSAQAASGQKRLYVRRAESGRSSGGGRDLDSVESSDVVVIT